MIEIFECRIDLNYINDELCEKIQKLEAEYADIQIRLERQRLHSERGNFDLLLENSTNDTPAPNIHQAPSHRQRDSDWPSYMLIEPPEFASLSATRKGGSHAPVNTENEQAGKDHQAGNPSWVSQQ